MSVAASLVQAFRSNDGEALFVRELSMELVVDADGESFGWDP